MFRAHDNVAMHRDCFGYCSQNRKALSPTKDNRERGQTDRNVRARNHRCRRFLAGDDANTLFHDFRCRHLQSARRHVTANQGVSCGFRWGHRLASHTRSTMATCCWTGRTADCRGQGEEGCNTSYACAKTIGTAEANKPARCMRWHRDAGSRRASSGCYET